RPNARKLSSRATRERSQQTIGARVASRRERAMSRSILRSVFFASTSIFTPFAFAQTASPDDPNAHVEPSEKHIEALETAKQGILALQNDTASIRFRPVLQADGRFFVAGGTSSFLARRIRPAIEAT